MNRCRGLIIMIMLTIYNNNTLICNLILCIHVWRLEWWEHSEYGGQEECLYAFFCAWHRIDLRTNSIQIYDYYYHIHWRTMQTMRASAWAWDRRKYRAKKKKGKITIYTYIRKVCVSVFDTLRHRHHNDIVFRHCHTFSFTLQFTIIIHQYNSIYYYQSRPE